jgi:hypothetical protein
MLRAETLIRTTPEPEEGGAWLLAGQKMPQSLQELISVARGETGIPVVAAAKKVVLINIKAHFSHFRAETRRCI